MTEPMLQPLTGESLRYKWAITEDHARLDVAASGLWGSRFERTFIDVRVFNPHARSYRPAPRTTVYQRHEQEKRRKYEERVQEVERTTFVPAVISACGGMGKAASALFKGIAALIAEKKGESYQSVMAFNRCKLSFSLLRSCIMCFRGSRRLSDSFIATVALSSLAVVEARISIIRHFCCFLYLKMGGSRSTPFH